MWKRIQLLLLGVFLGLPIQSSSLFSQVDNFHELAEESLAQIEGTFTAQGLQAPVEVLRDEWGVAHIYAQNLHDLFFTQGYVQAQDRLWQMDMWRRANEGRLSEILGPGALEHDKLARLVEFRRSWEEEFSSYHPQGRMIFQAFADGVNAYIDQIGDNLPVNYKLTGLEPLRWTPQASTGRVATALPIRGGRSELRLAQAIAERGLEAVNREEGEGIMNWIDLVVPKGVDLTIIPDEAIEALGGGDTPDLEILPKYQDWPAAVATINTGAQTSQLGSNNWVVSGDLTATGEVLLANDPHRGVQNPSLRYLVHLSAPGYDVIGATEPAIPGVAIGHNGKIGWGLTIVGTDQADVFVEQLNPDNPNEALWQGEWYPLEVDYDTIAVKGEEPRIVEFKYSRHGPIFYTDLENDVAYAIRATSSDPGGGGYLGGIRLAELDDCYEFVDAMEYWHAPDENMICGDVDGNIAWVAAGLAPNRVGEDWYGRLPVPGTGEYSWNGFRSPTELPHLINPERDWIATANNDVQPPGYFPPIMFKGSESSRWDRLQQIFADTDSLTAEDFEEMQHDMIHPWWVSDDLPLFQGWTSDDEEVEWARQQLIEWNGAYHRISVAPALHYRWRQALADEAREPGVSEARRNELSEAALAEAIETIRAAQGNDRKDWRWGHINRNEFPHEFVAAYDLPAVERSGDGGTIFDTGATFREIIDFSDFNNSRATSTPGQSMQPGSPYYDNLLPIWADEDYFPLLYTREAVEAKTDHVLRLTPAR
ncbi:MAG TPA: penicillin acylase family protein [Longimicrobiaceae bacterium]|nr:penicillin acylase family protein [Longimicrobiaceae bacterium]